MNIRVGMMEKLQAQQDHGRTRNRRAGEKESRQEWERNRRESELSWATDLIERDR